MEWMDLVRERRSVRRYCPKPVPQELVTRVLEAIRTAPSAGNFQSYEIYVVSGLERMKALAGTTFNHDWISQAPMALVICTNAARCEYDNKAHWALQDASIAATLAHLTATDLGLASCWVGAFIPAKVAEVFDIPAAHVPMALLTIGYAAETPQESPRRAISEFVHECK